MPQNLTEKDNPNTLNIDQIPIPEVLELINREDQKVARAVKKALPEISTAIERIILKLKSGGRLFYVGTGTSGRLGVLDASEIPPTFGVSNELIQGIIAGGFDALHSAVEASEDDTEAGKTNLKERALGTQDVVIGITASGQTPYTIGAVEFGKTLGCFTACITCNPGSLITKSVDIAIVAPVGPEVLTGSTRMKAGTAQKMILNMISTTLMIKLGFVRGNKMTNLKPKNRKLVERSLRILMAELDLEKEEAGNLFDKAKNDLRIALVMGKTGADMETSLNALNNSDFIIDKAIKIIKTTR